MNNQKRRHIFYLKNKEKILTAHRMYYVSHKEKVCEQLKKYYLKHKKEIAVYQRHYRLKNRIKLLIQHENARKRRLKTNVNARIKYNLRARLHKALYRNQKTDTTIKLLGCSIEFLKHHLESQFKPGMSWSNYGKWHIDHIKPCASFDLSKPSEQRKCFHYTNLQPLWAKENIIKGKN